MYHLLLPVNVGIKKTKLKKILLVWTLSQKKKICACYIMRAEQLFVRKEFGQQSHLENNATFK